MSKTLQLMDQKQWIEGAQKQWSLVRCPSELCKGAAVVTNEPDPPESGLFIAVCLECRKTFLPVVNDKALSWAKVAEWEEVENLPLDEFEFDDAPDESEGEGPARTVRAR